MAPERHGWHGEGRLGAAKMEAISWLAWEIERLAGRHFPGIGRGDTVANQETSQSPILKTNGNARRVLNLKTATGVGGKCANAFDLADDEA